MSEDDTIPLLDDLVRSGVDPVPADAVSPSQQASTESEASENNQPPDATSLDQQIHGILQRHMDAARAEIMQLLQQQTKSGNND